MTRARVQDIINRVYIRRFLTADVPSIDVLQPLLESSLGPEVTNKVLLYHAALAEDLLYDFVTEHLFSLHDAGRYRLNTSDALVFIDYLTRQGLISPPWSDNIRLKTGRGLLAAARDFGLLDGREQKRFGPVFLPMEAFIYVAYHLKDNGIQANRIMQHSDWRIFLDPPLRNRVPYAGGAPARLCALQRCRWGRQNRLAICRSERSY